MFRRQKYNLYKMSKNVRNYWVGKKYIKYIKNGSALDGPGSLSCWTPVSLQVCRNYSPEVEVAVSRVASQPASAPPHLPLSGLLLPPWCCGSRGRGPLLPGVGGEARGTEHLLEVQSQRGGRMLLQVVLKPPQDEWGNLRTPWDQMKQ